MQAAAYCADGFQVLRYFASFFVHKIFTFRTTPIHLSFIYLYYYCHFIILVLCQLVGGVPYFHYIDYICILSDIPGGHGAAAPHFARAVQRGLPPGRQPVLLCCGGARRFAHPHRRRAGGLWQRPVACVASPAAKGDARRAGRVHRCHDGRTGCVQIRRPLHHHRAARAACAANPGHAAGAELFAAHGHFFFYLAGDFLSRRSIQGKAPRGAQLCLYPAVSELFPVGFLRADRPRGRHAAAVPDKMRPFLCAGQKIVPAHPVGPAAQAAAG